ncbi:DNA adenine methylase, partial [Helicobacter sp. T3_23-1056]
MNYIGSKLKLSDFIAQSITQRITKSKPLRECVFCDLFAGTGAIGRAFKRKVRKVIANDREFYSFVLNQNYIANHTPIQNLNALVANLNNLQGIKGKIYENYSLGGTQGKAHQRLYFSDSNAMKIDAIRVKIENLKQQNAIDSNEYYFLLASLLESADKVANVASVYGAFLKNLKKSALKTMEFKGADFEINDNSHEVFNENASDLIAKIKGDILYLDPPYNAREYGANYHLLNTIALYDDFTPQGKTGLRTYQKSDFCKKGSALNALENLVRNADFEWIFLSYNDEGILGLEQIASLFKNYGKYERVSKIYQRFKADST